jgi:hypothetical protein
MEFPPFEFLINCGKIKMVVYDIKNVSKISKVKKVCNIVLNTSIYNRVL